MGAILRVDIVSRYDDKGTKTATERLDSMASTAKVAFAGVAAAGAGAVKAASDQQQAFGALDTVFKQNSGSMKAWAQDQAAMGLSATEAANNAAYMGTQLQNAGYSMNEAATEAQALTGLGADLAATFGGSATDAVDALGAALRGETDAIERYGVSIKQADVNARLAANGQDQLTGEALKQAEMAARLELIWEQTADAQGQAGREADTVAGRMGALTAEASNLAATFGEALLPYAEQLLGILQGWLPIIEANAGLITGLVVAVGGFAAGIIALNAAISAYQTIVTVVTAVTKAWRTAQLLLNVALMVNPIGLLVAAVALLVAAIVGLVAWFVHLYKTNEEFREKVDAIWAKIQQAWDALVSFLKDAWTTFVAVFSRTLDDFKRGWDAFTSWLGRTWDTVVSGLRRAWDTVVSTVRRVMDQIRNIIDGVLRKIRDISAAVRGPFVAAFSTAKRVIGSAISWLIRQVERLLSKLREASRSARSAITPSWSWFGSSSVPTAPTYAGDDGPSAAQQPGATFITVQGAVDPVETANQIRRLLDRNSTRMGAQPLWMGDVR